MGPLEPKEVESQQDKSMFYPTHDNSIRDLRYYYKKMYCFDYEAMKEQGMEPNELEV